MTIGIGGAGSKLSTQLDPATSTIINVSDIELEKFDAHTKLRAVAHSTRAQLRGARKDPSIGRDAFYSVREKLTDIIRNDIVFSSTGGGTGNGLCTELLDYLSGLDSVPIVDKTMFVFVLPYPELEASEFVDNTLQFLEGPVSRAIDAGNTGNLILFSNQQKFLTRLQEDDYNRLMLDSLQEFLVIPEKGARFDHLDGNIDFEDFHLYTAKPYFNHFCRFDFDPGASFEKQLKSNYNNLLLAPEGTIEAMFLLEVPDADQAVAFYDILDYFAKDNVSPTYSVVHNPDIKKPSITVSILYSRKPLELVDDFNVISGKRKRTRVKKSLDQYVTLTKLEIDMTDETRKAAKDVDQDGEEIINVLKRIGKL